MRERTKRFNAEGLDGLGDRPGTGRKPRRTEHQGSQLIALVTQPPPGGCAARPMGAYAPTSPVRRPTGPWTPAAQAAPDLLGGGFTAAGPDQRWCGDITSLRVADRFLYLATVLDLHPRRLVSWSLADHARAELAGDALEAAMATRGGTIAGVVFHTDHGGSSPRRPSPSCATATVWSSRWAASATGWTTRSPKASSPPSNASSAATGPASSRHGWRVVMGRVLHPRRRHSTLGYHSPIDDERITAPQQPDTA